MAKRICSVIEDGQPCPNPAVARCMCGKHYQRTKRHGAPIRIKLDYSTGPSCKTPGCDEPARGRGWCVACYHGWERHGDPIWRPASDAERFWKMVDKTIPSGCWLWTGATTDVGYARFNISDKWVLGHRWAWMQIHGEIPSSQHLDHLCHTNDLTCRLGNACPHRRCVNPDHLERVTPKENAQRGRNAFGTHCLKGHDLAIVGIYVYPSGPRQCRACRREWAHNKYQ